MEISVLIVSYNTRKYLKACIDSIFASRTSYAYEIIVVDNNSADGSVELLRNEYASVKLIRNRYNYGFSVAMNQAFRASNGKYVMSFNPDAEVFEETLQLAISYMESHLEVGKVGLATWYKGGITLPHSNFNRFERPHLFKLIGIGNSTPLVHMRPFKVDWIFGTGLVIRRSALPVDHIYPEDSFLFWEEYALSKQIREQGFELHVLPDVSIMHHTSVTFKVNKHRVFWARLLSHAHEWRVRSNYYGRINALINSLIFFADNVILYFMLKAKSMLKNNPDPGLLVELNDRKARARSAFIVLSATRKKLQAIDKQAARFFNDGVDPVYPPEVETS